MKVFENKKYDTEFIEIKNTEVFRSKLFSGLFMKIDRIYSAEDVEYEMQEHDYVDDMETIIFYNAINIETGRFVRFSNSDKVCVIKGQFIIE